MPSAAAWLKTLSQKATPAGPAFASQLPKLRFMIRAGSGCVSTTYWLVTPTPLTLAESSLMTSAIVAPGATLVARVTSTVDSI